MFLRWPEVPLEEVFCSGALVALRSSNGVSKLPTIRSETARWAYGLAVSSQGQSEYNLRRGSAVAAGLKCSELAVFSCAFLLCLRCLCW